MPKKEKKKRKNQSHKESQILLPQPHPEVMPKNDEKKIRFYRLLEKFLFFLIGIYENSPMAHKRWECHGPPLFTSGVH